MTAGDPNVPGAVAVEASRFRPLRAASTSARSAPLESVDADAALSPTKRVGERHRHIEIQVGSLLGRCRPSRDPFGQRVAEQIAERGVPVVRRRRR